MALLKIVAAMVLGAFTAFVLVNFRSFFGTAGHAADRALSKRFSGRGGLGRIGAAVAEIFGCVFGEDGLLDVCDCGYDTENCVRLQQGENEKLNAVVCGLRRDEARLLRMEAVPTREDSDALLRFVLEGHIPHPAPQSDGTRPDASATGGTEPVAPPEHKGDFPSGLGVETGGTVKTDVGFLDRMASLLNRRAYGAVKKVLGQDSFLALVLGNLLLDLSLPVLVFQQFLLQRRIVRLKRSNLRLEARLRDLGFPVEAPKADGQAGRTGEQDSETGGQDVLH